MTTQGDTQPPANPPTDPRDWVGPGTPPKNPQPGGDDEQGDDEESGN